MLLLGSEEGAGEGGWNEDAAREFASWADRFNVLLPAGTAVVINCDILESGTTLTIIDPKRPEVVPMSDGPDFEAALAIVARHFGAKLPKVEAPAKIYSIQLFASRSKARAETFSRLLDERGVLAVDPFFHAECHPCSMSATRVLEAGPDGWVRVIIGVYDRRSAAQRAARQLARTWQLEAFVREL